LGQKPNRFFVMFESFTGALAMGFAWNRKMCIIFSATTLLSTAFAALHPRAAPMLIGKTCSQLEGPCAV
jgi:hypothetical protein